MPPFVALILLALIFYTVAIFGERFIGTLKAWMLILFEFAFVSDTVGTILMARVASGVTLHGILGFSALAVMFLHLCWAMISFAASERARALFHRHSLKAWAVWMAAFFSGAFLR